MSVTIRDAYGLWKAGHDTFDIALMTGRKEQEILREISSCRSALLGKPYPYAPYRQPTLNTTPAPMRKQRMYKTRLRRPSKNIDRDRLILAELAAGKTMEAAAEKFGLTKQRIWQIFSQAKIAA
ncbi:MAG: hypothetical protein E5X05_01215 [Mesorhizobium sp.]|nr:MAG: hypothetical protein E5X05_01215 [Mesorhizobium sp.]